jgi:hypothetical protein
MTQELHKDLVGRFYQAFSAADIERCCSVRTENVSDNKLYILID